MIRALALVFVISLSACTSWRRSDGLLAEPIASRDRVQVWIGRTAHDVRGVKVQGDSLSAIPAGKPLNCESCRVGFARADVDSLRTADDSGGTIVIVGAATLALLILYLKAGLASNYP